MPIPPMASQCMAIFHALQPSACLLGSRKGCKTTSKLQRPSAKRPAEDPPSWILFLLNAHCIASIFQCVQHLPKMIQTCPTMACFLEALGRNPTVGWKRHLLVYLSAMELLRKREIEGPAQCCSCASCHWNSQNGVKNIVPVK